MLKNTAKAATEVDVKGMIDELVANAHSALKIMKTFDQEKIDHIVHRMAIAGLDHHMELAKLAVDETGRGVWEDKAIKICLPLKKSGIRLRTTRPLALSMKINNAAWYPSPNQSGLLPG
ncbi:bifunctional acetaldehyde-CoA/alcohol dehydrogenase [Lacticaseibacillus rhamnosus MTCC 5462]|nr:bifunctional acetaldehyde-CoA/alcohol dehydrogenase [Lacticaseibacillus rhamnosus MTCC 5462]